MKRIHEYIYNSSMEKVVFVGTNEPRKTNETSLLLAISILHLRIHLNLCQILDLNCLLSHHSMFWCPPLNSTYDPDSKFWQTSHHCHTVAFWALGNQPTFTAVCSVLQWHDYNLWHFLGRNWNLGCEKFVLDPRGSLLLLSSLIKIYHFSFKYSFCTIFHRKTVSKLVSGLFVATGDLECYSEKILR